MSARTLKAYTLGKRAVSRMPGHIRDRMVSASQGEIKFGVAADFDNTLVRTDEARRIFSFLNTDESGTIGPLAALAMLGIPYGVISGNTTEYVEARCTQPLVDHILDSRFKEAIRYIATYALNGGFITLFEGNGAQDLASMREYNEGKQMPEEHAKLLTTAMLSCLRQFILTSKNGHLGKPLKIRSGGTETLVMSPIFENRVGVQKCILGVFEKDREALIDEIRRFVQRRSPEIFAELSIQPGGKHTIDGSMLTLDKTCAGRDFMLRFDCGHLFYLGDSVYVKDGKVGNDLSMVNNPSTTVLAVNQEAHNVPAHENVFWLGSGPDAANNWMTWLLIERANAVINNEPGRTDSVWQILQYAGLCSSSQ